VAETERTKAAASARALAAAHAELHVLSRRCATLQRDAELERLTPRDTSSSDMDALRAELSLARAGADAAADDGMRNGWRQRQ
jgi:hypothetical protein